MRASTCLRTGACFAGLAVLLGAFAAHAMKAHFPAEQLTTFETGVRWQMFHALALLLCAAFAAPGRRLAIAAWCFTAGIVLFSGSLYGYVLLEWKWLVALTPIGGITFVLGWIVLATTAGRAAGIR